MNEKIAIACGLFFVLFGCSSAHASLPASAIASTNSLPAPSNTTAPSSGSSAQPSSTAIENSVPFLEPFTFEFGQRNPFQPPAAVSATGSNQMLPGSPLERYDLDEIKLIAIMWDVRHPKAMFMDPQGHTYVLGVDDRIGRKHGYIAAIRDGEVVVMEARNYNGQAVYSPRIVQIEHSSQ